MPCESVNWISVSATLAAAFSGAWFAFLLDARMKRKKIEDDHVRDGNLALYNLSDYWSSSHQYYKEVIHPYRDKSDAWLNMPPATKRYSRTPSLNNLDLSFILGTPQTEVYAQVYLEENRYHTVQGMINERDDLILNKVRPAMNKAGLKEGDNIDLMDAKAIVGENVAILLKHMTDGIISNVQENLESLQDTYTILRGVLTELYPKHTIISVQFGLDDEDVVLGRTN